jgi:hypothetical protein
MHPCRRAAAQENTLGGLLRLNGKQATAASVHSPWAHTDKMIPNAVELHQWRKVWMPKHFPRHRFQPRIGHARNLLPCTTRWHHCTSYGLLIGKKPRSQPSAARTFVLDNLNHALGKTLLQALCLLAGDPLLDNDLGEQAI